MILTQPQLIELLGGTSAVSRICQVSPPAVTQWKVKGIPQDKLYFLAAELEKQSHGLVTRKELFPETWQFVWPELANKAVQS